MLLCIKFFKKEEIMKHLLMIASLVLHPFAYSTPQTVETGTQQPIIDESGGVSFVVSEEDLLELDEVLTPQDRERIAQAFEDSNRQALAGLPLVLYPLYPILLTIAVAGSIVITAVQTAMVYSVVGCTVGFFFLTQEQAQKYHDHLKYFSIVGSKSETAGEWIAFPVKGCNDLRSGKQEVAEHLSSNARLS